MKILLSGILLFLSLNAHSQTFNVFAGYAHDMNNEAKSFNFIPIKIEWTPAQKNNRFSFFANYDAGINVKSQGEAYTLNPELPSSVVLKEFIKTNLISFGVDLNFNLYTDSSGNQLSFSFSPGAFSFQHLNVSYPGFDKENYEILDQDIGRKSSGLIFKLGLDYRFGYNKIIALEISTPLLKQRPKEFIYLYAAPLYMMVGYQFKYKKITITDENTIVYSDSIDDLYLRQLLEAKVLSRS